MVDSGERIRLAPPAKAKSHSRLRRLWHARCRATSEEEQAVSSATLGPLSPRTYDKRPATELRAFPVA